MSQPFESCRWIFQSEQGLTLRSGNRHCFEFDLPEQRRAQALRLFVTGETALNYLWKNEPDYPYQYRKIVDALDQTHASQAQYCLDFSNRRQESYIKQVCKTVPWPPQLSYLPLTPLGDSWTGGIRVKTRQLCFQPGGYLRLRFDLRYRRPDHSPADLGEAAQSSRCLDIPAGSYDWRTVSCQLQLPAETLASVMVFIEGINYQGEVYLERPFLQSESGWNLLSDFVDATPDKQAFDWLGVNLSRKEWPEFSVSLNGTEIFKGEVFERCHRHSEWEIELPTDTLLNGQNCLQITNCSAYHDPLPYTFFSLGLIGYDASPLRLIYAPDYVPAYRQFGLLIYLDQPDELSLDSQAFSTDQILKFTEPGFQVIQLRAGAARSQAAWTLIGRQGRIDHQVLRVVEKADDDIHTGSSDILYINHNRADFSHFLSWYLSQQVGNQINLRHSYRWNGTRQLNPDAWNFLIPLLNQLKFRYNLIRDGRELPGMAANPDHRLLDGPQFAGFQEHELDGAQFYWGNRNPGHSETQLTYHGLEQQVFMDQPGQTASTHSPENFLYDDQDPNSVLWLYRNPVQKADMAAGREYAVNRLSALRNQAARHTGPSVMFKYFYQAGFGWLGAETMYGSLEPLLAFLRGASAAYGHISMGVHVAVQWSTTPHDTASRYRRYRLGLYLPYMLGMTEINTEEGFWHMEEYYSYFNRFSPACLNHLAQQQDFYRFVRTHTRRGKFYAAAAFLQGRDDGWHGFTNRHPWGFNTPCEEPENSWQLLKVPYPQSKPGEALYIYDCPEEASGYYSSAPWGNIDVIPAESPADLLQRYRFLSFTGYNRAQKEDFDRLLAYVEAGGCLLLGWPHLTVTTDREALTAYRLDYLDHPLLQRIAAEPVFQQDRLDGKRLQVGRLGPDSQVQIMSYTDQGAPLLIKRPIGAGTLWFVNAQEYPGNPALMPVYTAVLQQQLQLLQQAEPVAVQTEANALHAIYVREDGSRDVYLTAIDWYHAPDKPRQAWLRLLEHTYPVSFPFGVLLKIVCWDRLAAWCDSEDAEVLAVSARGFTAQGSGSVLFHWVKDGCHQTVCVDFSSLAKQEICFE
ncbi:hypothetical protein HCH52_02305 [Oscillospiraceae bacterium HV4-5-C5C]|nr:hypothetical protein [Oscillospiraceae bacterium HV4-5-C5C]